MIPRQQTTKTACAFLLLALFALLLPGQAAAGYCDSTNPDKVPPFLTPGVDPNMLMIIDNSASMYDLAYIDDAGYCYDETYDTAVTPTTYAGYFESDGWYLYDFTGDRFAAAAMENGCSDANYRKGVAGAREVCLKTVTSTDADGDEVITVVTFAARGNYLNWASASKMDIEKKVLTGGKYGNNALVLESRGCLEKRFVKETTIDPAGLEGSNSWRLTVAIRQPNDEEKAVNPADLHTTRIEIYAPTVAGYNHDACQLAVEEVKPPANEDEEAKKQRLGRLKGYIDTCMGFGDLPPNDPEVASQGAFNQAIQTCWFIIKHGDTDSVSGGDIQRIINSCEGVYQGNGPPGVNPINISPDHSSYVCYGDYNAKRINHPVQASGYVGYCWDHDAVTWRPNNKINQDGWKPNTDVSGNLFLDVNACVKAGLIRYCTEIDVPVVNDPSDQVTGAGDETGEFWNLPAVLVDAGVIGQLGHPIAVLKGRLGQTEAPSGLLQEFAADLRIGAMTFNRDGAMHECTLPGASGTYACDTGVRDGGMVIAPLGKGVAHTQSLVAAINDIVADTWTPLGESIYNAIGYYLQDGTMRLHLNDFSTAEDPITAWCQRNNILLITDGAPTADLNPQMVNFAESLNYDLGSGACDALHGSTYLDDLARYGYHGLSADPFLVNPPYASPAELLAGGTAGEGKRRPINTYVVAAGKFRDEGTDKCNPNVLLADTAQSGGTTLFQAENLNELEEALRLAFLSIRAGAVSGSAASVISATRSGEGAVYQAIFWPEKYDSAIPSNKITWAGEVQSLLVDAHGRLFEDTNGNRKLDPPCADPTTATPDGDCDRQITVFYDSGAEASRACYGHIEDNGTCSSGMVVDISEVKYLWGANSWLAGITDGAITANRSEAQYLTESAANERYIFTWHDSTGDGKVGAMLPFVAGSSLSPSSVAANYQDFGLNSVEEAQEVINWVRGLDQAGLRSRRHNGNTWRLGDVVHSTPTVVSRPMEGYHFLYRDPSYAEFARKYNHRRHMVYFGGNDGMLHAVNGGFFNSNQNKFCLTQHCAEDAEGYVGTPLPLGAEVWAYVPYNLWPHLKCLTEELYGHKYYVDLVPRIFDVQIFDKTDPDYPNGWGTILVGGMRFGGEKVLLNGKTFSSAYFILDITNPEAPPKLLGEMTFTGSEAEMGFTTSVPTMVPMVVKESGHSEWYLVIGSGPTTLKGQSTQRGRVAVIDLKTLANGNIPFRIPATSPGAGIGDPQVGSFELPDLNSFVSDPVTVDFGLNYRANAVYFGTVSGDFGNWGGKVYRLVTEKRDVTTKEQVFSLPHEWPDLLADKELVNPLPLIDVGQPVTAAPAVSWDYNNYWVYFGTGRLYNRNDYNDESGFHYYGIKEPWDCVNGNFTWATVNNWTPDHLSANPLEPGERGLWRVDQIKVMAAQRADQAELKCVDETDNCKPTGVTVFSGLRDYIAGQGCTASDPADRGTDGWYRKFECDPVFDPECNPESPRKGERNLGQATLLGGLLTYAAYLPSDDICTPEGTSDLYALYFQTGTAWHRPIFKRELVAGEEVEYQQLIGPGLAVSPSLHVGTDTGAKAFLQTSTGAIISLEQPELPFSDYRTGREWWREIYRNILE